jgi:hypothetical protein
LPAGVPNALLVAADGAMLGEADVAAAVQLLKARADRKDDAFFTRRGFESARDFYAHYLRLSAVLLLNLVNAGARQGAAFVGIWLNKEARLPLPEGAATACLRCLQAGLPPDDLS